MKKFKSVLAVVLVSTLVTSFAWQNPLVVSAEESVDAETEVTATDVTETSDVVESSDSVEISDESFGTGLEEYTEVTLDDSDTVVVDDTKYSHTAVSNSAYSEYTNDYFYNQLSTTEKAFYNKMYMACQNLLTSSSDALYASGSYWTNLVSYTGLSFQQALRVAEIMSYSNPQFYFIDASYATKGASLALGVYDDFGPGANRTKATNYMFSIVKSDLTLVNAQSSTYAKQKMAHDIVCMSADYDDTLKAAYNQGAYSVFVNGSSVCAGYAEAFSMLCNAAGIQTVCVTSSGHEWNLVQLNGTWYYVDCTWDDGNGTVYDNVFLDCGTNTISMDTYTYTNHTPESTIWSGIYPSISATDYAYTSSEISGYTAPTYKRYTPLSFVATQVMYRMYNPNSGEHFYTANANEKDMLVSVGWNYEGTAWTAPVSSGTPVYRMYNPNAGDHHYTTSAAERDMLKNAGWNYEGVGWYSADSKTTPLYRLYNPNAIAGAHHYTVNYNEATYLQSLGWKYEGLAWYGM